MFGQYAEIRERHAKHSVYKMLDWKLVTGILGILTFFLWPKLTSWREKAENKKKIRKKREIIRTRKATLEEM